MFILVGHAHTELGAPVMQDTCRIKEHEQDIRLDRTQTSAVSEHTNNTGHKPLWNEVKFIDHDPHWYACGVQEATSTGIVE